MSYQQPPQGPWQPPQWQQQPPPQPYYQQPPPQYQRPPMMPPQRPPRKKLSRRAWLIIGGIVLLLIIASAANANKNSGTPIVAATATPTTIIVNSQATATPVLPTATTTKATATPKLVTVQSFSGHSSGGNWYYSPYFVVPNNWEVSWTCTNGDTSLPLVTIVAYDHSGNPLAGDDDLAAHGNCSSASGFGTVQKHGGTIRLQIYDQGNWVVTVNAFK